MFADADPHVLEKSYGTVHLYKYLGTNSIRIIDVKWIMDVVGMVPFKYTHRETNFSEGKQYFAVEKMSFILVSKCEMDGFNEEE